MNYFEWLFDEQRRLFLEMERLRTQREARMYVISYNAKMTEYLNQHPEWLKPGSIIPMQSKEDLQIIRPKLNLEDW